LGGSLFSFHNATEALQGSRAAGRAAGVLIGRNPYPTIERLSSFFQHKFLLLAELAGRRDKWHIGHQMDAGRWFP
jgi:hypothetical protein